MADTRYDFHVHYKAHAKDAVGYEEAMVQRAVEVGLTGICFTEHFQRMPSDRIAELRAKYPIKIWSGVEVNCAEGNDILIFGKCEIPPPAMPWIDLLGHVVLGCKTCLAHPWRKGRLVPNCFTEHLPDYIEIASRNTPTWAAPKIAAEFEGRPFLVNSDAHKPKHLGWHFNYRDMNAEWLANWLEERQ